MAENNRGTCWSVTINNPTESDLKPELPAGWRMEGQIEEGAEGTEHYQGMVNTPQVRFSAVKKVFPRAHIELAKNRKALEKYVHKSETRVAEVSNVVSNIPTLFAYQHTIAARWDDDEYDGFVLTKKKSLDDTELGKLTGGDYAMEYVDYLVGLDIEKGICGIEYIAINPMWRSAWKKFYRQLVARERTAELKSQQDIYNAREEDVPQETAYETQTSCAQACSDKQGSTADSSEIHL